MASRSASRRSQATRRHPCCPGRYPGRWWLKVIAGRCRTCCRKEFWCWLPRTQSAGARGRRGRMEELKRLRVRGVLILTMLGWTSTIALLLLALVFDFRNEMLAVAFSAAINIVPTFYALREHYDEAAGTSLGIMAAVHPALLVYMLQGHPWQMEAHMYFF